MLRSILIYLSQANWARKLVTQWDFAWKIASRFIAGEISDEAIVVVKELNSRGINATLDHLGEFVSNSDEAVNATEEIIQLLNEIQQSDVRAGVSIKLSQIGLLLDFELCKENLQGILETAKTHDNFVRIDMEDSEVTDVTLDLYEWAMGAGFKDHVGIVIQSYLYRSESDIRVILEGSGKVRLCKGAYKELPDVAYPKKSEVDINFDLITRMLIDGIGTNDEPVLSSDGKHPPIPAIATHDEKRIILAKAYFTEQGYPKETIEFQMLHGIRRDLQESLIKEGYPVRVYVPYGTEWYPYFVRRLAERPANLWFFLSQLFK